jgi:hypothetical protein
MNRLTAIIIAVLLLIIIGQQGYISFYQCKECPEISSSIDTTTTVEIDTIKPEVKLTETISHNPRPTRSYPVPQEVDTVTGITIKRPCDTINIYEDSLITPYANAYLIDTVQGRKLGSKLSILQKGPNEIIKTITTTITKTDTIKVPNPVSALYAGVGVSGTFINGFKIADIKPELAFISKGGNSYEYGYGLFTQRHEITFKKVIFKNKK